MLLLSLSSPSLFLCHTTPHLADTLQQAHPSASMWLQELAEELEDLHDTVDDVLAILHRVMGS